MAKYEMSKPNELLEPLEALVDIVEDDHYKCDIDSDEECHLLADGEWQIKYQHGALRQAKQAIKQIKRAYFVAKGDTQ